MRHRPLAALLLLTTFTFGLFLYIRFQTYDLVSLGLCRIAPFSPPCLTSPSTMLSPSATELDTLKLHPSRTRGRVSLTIGSLNIRFSRDSAFDPLRSVFSSPFTASRGTGSPDLMKQYWGERSWLLRGPKVADVALFNNWDLFAFQEVLDGQLSNLVSWLGEEYDYAGVGRDDGHRAGEAVPIFWRRDTFSLVPSNEGGVGTVGVEHFWLSPTPTIIGSVGWDAALTRMCTHVSLRLLATGEILHVFSTHYDHQGVTARAKSSELILQRARLATAHTKTLTSREPLVVLIGDLNSPRNEGSWSTLVSPHYGLEANSSGESFLDTALSVPTRNRSPLLRDNEDPLRSELASGRRKAGSPEKGGGEAMLSEPVGPLRTFTDFQPSPRRAIDDRIDFIMLLDNDAVLDQTRKDAVLDHSKSYPPPKVVGRDEEEKETREEKREGGEGQWKVRTFGTLPNWSEGDAGFLISDHRPVMTRIQRSVAVS